MAVDHYEYIGSMRFIAILPMVLGSGIGLCQDTTYFDHREDTVHSLALAHHYSIWSALSAIDGTFRRKVFEVSGFLTEESNWIKVPSGELLLHGRHRFWFPVTEGWVECNYIRDQLDGDFRSWWKNGALKRHDVYSMGVHVSGEMHDSLGNPLPWVPFESTASFPGGEAQLFAYLGENLRYPRKAMRNRIEGRIELEFMVLEDGAIADIQVLKSVHPLLDEEALRVVSSMPRWIPAQADGMTMKQRYRLPIRFDIER